jgi:hypothetical protein
MFYAFYKNQKLQGQYPVAEYLASHVVNLPTTPSDINKVLAFLETYIEFIIDA